MTNTHIKNAAGYIEVAQAVSRHTSGNPPTADLCALAQAEALLAIAHELHTANLIARRGQYGQGGTGAEMDTEINKRLK